MFELHVTEISRVVQLVITPAFLLAGIGTFLNVMTQRLARVIDRAIELSRDDTPLALPPEREVLDLVDKLAIRAKLINRAIALCTSAAIMVCLLIALMFLDALLNIDMGWAVGTMFVLSMLTMLSGLILFLREVFVATESLRGRHVRAGRGPLRIQA
jgi:hypothetical protein